jgi:uncharacterized membrane protein YfcA
MKTRKYLLKAKICDTGVVMLLLCLLIAFVCVWLPQYMPVYVLALIIMILTLVRAYYVVVVEESV